MSGSEQHMAARKQANQSYEDTQNIDQLLEDILTNGNKQLTHTTGNASAASYAAAASSSSHSRSSHSRSQYRHQHHHQHQLEQGVNSEINHNVPPSLNQNEYDVNKNDQPMTERERLLMQELERAENQLKNFRRAASLDNPLHEVHNAPPHFTGDFGDNQYQASHAHLRDIENNVTVGTESRHLNNHTDSYHQSHPVEVWDQPNSNFSSPAMSRTSEGEYKSFSSTHKESLKQSRKVEEHYENTRGTDEYSESVTCFQSYPLPGEENSFIPSQKPTTPEHTSSLRSSESIRQSTRYNQSESARQTQQAPFIRRLEQPQLFHSQTLGQTHTLNSHSTITQTQPEVYEEIESTTLKPIGRGVHNLESQPLYSKSSKHQYTHHSSQLPQDSYTEFESATLQPIGRGIHDVTLTHHPTQDPNFYHHPSALSHTKHHTWTMSTPHLNPVYTNSISGPRSISAHRAATLRASSVDRTVQDYYQPQAFQSHPRIPLHIRTDAQVNNRTQHTFTDSRHLISPVSPSASLKHSPIAQKYSPRNDVNFHEKPSHRIIQDNVFVQSSHISPKMRMVSTKLSSYGSNDAIDFMPGGPPKFVTDTSQFWYKPKITREEAINILKELPPGNFIVRDSSSYPGGFGIAVKVLEVPKGTVNRSGDPDCDLVRHFLIEPTSKGVRLKGCANEPVFASLAALVYQHTIMQLALPCKLVLPNLPPVSPGQQRLSHNSDGGVDPMEILNQGAACNVLFMGTVDVESLTGSNAIARAADVLFKARSSLRTTECQLKVAIDGITLTDNHRKLFFRRHYPTSTISHCGTDPKDRSFETSELQVRGLLQPKIFGFVARKHGSLHENTAVIVCEMDINQPAGAVIKFICKYLINR